MRYTYNRDTHGFLELIFWVVCVLWEARTCSHQNRYERADTFLLVYIFLLQSPFSGLSTSSRPAETVGSTHAQRIRISPSCGAVFNQTCDLLLFWSVPN